MKQRVITGIFIGIGFALLYVLLPLWLGAYSAVLAIAPAVLAFGIFAAVGVWELLVTTGACEKHPLVYLSMGCAFLMSPVTVWGSSWHLLALVFAFMVAIFACGVLDHTRVSFATMSKALLAGFLLPLMLTSVVRILAAHPYPNQVLMALAPWLVVWVCDSAALFVGRALGKRKLAPYVSPKKTVAGFVGGLAGGVIAMLVVLIVLVKLGWHLNGGGIQLLLYGLVAAALGQLGDLSLSVIKRESGIKDYGRLFPGHGGVYDRFDSILFAAPLFELLFVHLLPSILS